MEQNANQTKNILGRIEMELLKKEMTVAKIIVFAMIVIVNGWAYYLISLGLKHSNYFLSIAVFLLYIPTILAYFTLILGNEQ